MAIDSREQQLAAEHMARCQRRNEIAAKFKRHMAEAPFYSQDLLIGPPTRTWKDFQHPRLRRCPIDLEDMIWDQPLGGGLDGYCWKVTVDDQPYVLKMVRTEPNPPASEPHALTAC